MPGKKGWVKMEKKFVVVRKVSVMIMTLVLLVIFRENALEVRAETGTPVSEEAEQGTGEAAKERGVETEPVSEEEAEEVSGKRLMKTIPLESGETAQVPRYIVEGKATYVLDESSIVVEETGRGSSEGADVVTFSREVEGLPDNDLTRIEKTMLYEGITCELLSVIYEVAKEDENGIPVRYSAVCEYGGLKKYSTSYPTAWQMTVWYDFCEEVGETDEVTELVEYEYIYVPAERASEDGGSREREIGKPRTEKNEDPFSEPEKNKIQIRPIVGREEKERKKIIDIPMPLAAAAVGAGLTLPFIIWFSIATAPIFALKKERKYRYIGQVRLKREEGRYTAYLTKRLLGRAGLPVFQIKLPGKVWKKAKMSVFQVHCPDGRKITLTAGKSVCFTVEGD